MTDQIMTQVGRLVQGHPMEIKTVYDDAGQPKINKLGDTQQEIFVAVAIPKAPGETDWKLTQWGQYIMGAAQIGWPNGEWQANTFAWKIIDGDSRIPNKKGKLPCDNEGFPGNWIINAKNGFAVDCYANGNYAQQVMQKEIFKTGDYVRLVISAKGNSPSQSPGVYINLVGCELVRAGIPIVSASSLDAEATFGSAAAVMPQDAHVDPNVHAAGATPQTGAVAQSATTTTPAQAVPPVAQAVGSPPPPPAPAHDFLTINGKQFTVDQLRAAGWTEAQITTAQ